MNKRGISPVIATVLLVLVVLAIAGVVTLFFQGFIEARQREAVKELAEQKCFEEFNFVISACYTESNINLQISNRYNEIIEGSLVELNSGTEKISILLPPGNIASGGGLDTTMNNPMGNNLKTIKLKPIFESEGIKVPCEEFPEVPVSPCS